MKKRLKKKETLERLQNFLVLLKKTDLPKTWLKNSHNFFNVSYTYYKSLSWAALSCFECQIEGMCYSQYFFLPISLFRIMLIINSAATPKGTKMRYWTFHRHFLISVQKIDLWVYFIRQIKWHQKGYISIWSVSVFFTKDWKDKHEFGNVLNILFFLLRKNICDNNFSG